MHHSVSVVMLYHYYTVFARSDATATFYFIAQFCVVSIREWRLYWRGNLLNNKYFDYLCYIICTLDDLISLVIVVCIIP